MFFDEGSSEGHTLTLELKDSHVKILFEDMNLTVMKDLQIYNSVVY